MNAYAKALFATAALALSAPVLASYVDHTYQKTVEVPQSSTNDVTTRYYRLYVPASYYSLHQNTSPATPAPLVIVMHGGGLSYRNINLSDYQDSVWTTTAQTTGDANNPGASAESLADQYGFIVAEPNATNMKKIGGDPNGYAQHWNDCTGRYAGSAGNTSRVDDVAFIRAMITSIETSDTDLLGHTFLIDPKHIYASGASNGGLMSLRLSREASDLFAANAATLAGDGAVLNSSPLQLSDVCQYAPTINSDGLSANPQANPVPLWLLKGDQDKWVDYPGGYSRGSSSSWIPYEPGYSGNAATTPANTTSMLLNWLRYGLGTAPPSSIRQIGPSVSCNIYGADTASGRAEIDDCIASPNGHVEPSISVQEGSIGKVLFGPQITTMETAAQAWLFFQGFAHP